MMKLRKKTREKSKGLKTYYDSAGLEDLVQNVQTMIFQPWDSIKDGLKRLFGARKQEE